MSRIALTLIIVGALNWLLVGIFEWDLVSAIFGGEVHRTSSAFSRIIYTLVGLAGIYSLSFFFRDDATVR
ncbi:MULTISPECIES: DUF378 domain-containing protein [Paenibacillus]|uniref:DUF378 domain-containing protein n=1 Tax=Paenibacillus TaxID=44249 RepID=UPI00020D6863|nr:MULTISPECIES: DUF378 domain-containing protein [Paenibacillus]EGL17204.1 hypothetical protein HMPREF9413_5513 [Paenibacillus sp. HGF7]EPD80715.1 hypothetical protein HMPREF1207_04471 [Paenibacillus sp. HGH0039]MBV6714580.1 DUF378 domain-containing protein [Paenibacillus chitinolyticus]GKS11885.1 DUF378 domain-containing protein [Paenibacillus chitinolyticus]